MAKKQKNQNPSQNMEAVKALGSIQNGLPEGYNVTNKNAVLKTIQEIGHQAETYWSSWVKKGKTKGLAYLKGDGIVKLILESDFPKFLFNGKAAV